MNMDMERQFKKWEREIEWIRKDNYQMRQQVVKMHDAMGKIVNLWLDIRYYQGIDDTLEE
jgi:hypothetical protein